MCVFHDTFGDLALLYSGKKKASGHWGCLLALIVCDTFLLLEQTEEFANPKHEGGAEDANNPIVEREARYVEHRATEGNNQDLSEHDNYGDAHEGVATLEVER